MVVWIHLVHQDMRNQFFNSELHEWVSSNLDHDMEDSLDFGWMNVWAMSCHMLWLWRNKEHHDGNFIRPMRPHSYIMLKLKEQ
jgi:hypothetical protein